MGGVAWCAGPSVCGVVAPVGCGALAVLVVEWALWSLWAVLRRRLGVCRALWLVLWAVWRVRLCPPLPVLSAGAGGAGGGAGGVMMCGVGVVDVGAVAGHVSCGGVVSCGGGVVQCVDVSGVSLRRDELVGVVRGVVCGGSGACVVRAHDVVCASDVGGVVSMLGRACGSRAGRVDLGVVDVSVVPRGVAGPVCGDVRGVCGGGVVGVRGWCRVVGSGSRV